MSERIEITINAEELRRALSGVEEQIETTEEKLMDMTEKVEDATTKSFNQVMGFMRTTYLMISGASRVLGGGMSQLFSTIYLTAISAIGTYKAIAAAMAASGPYGWVQAGLMIISLTTASLSLASILSGQRDLSRKIRGINMSLHGISGMISSFSI